MKDLTARIRSRALDLGFAAAGVAVAGPAEFSEEHRRWLDAGFAAGMRYLERHAELKEHPERVAPGVRSIIAVAARYPLNSDPASGGFSSYARGLDYHDVIRAKLRQLADYIDDIEADCRDADQRPVRRICVDSAPLPEREWALRAGIGWRGRQGQIINREAGACLLLGFLLTDLELEPSEPQENRCGNCRLCLEACPSGALQPDGRVDACRCISYLTIEPGAETRAGSPPNFHGWIFGCDCCTAVCPWNRKATAPVMPEFEESEPLPTAADLLHWNEADFERRFKGTAVFRTGLDQLQRTVSAE